MFHLMVFILSISKNKSSFYLKNIRTTCSIVLTFVKFFICSKLFLGSSGTSAILTAKRTKEMAVLPVSGEQYTNDCEAVMFWQGK